MNNKLSSEVAKIINQSNSIENHGCKCSLHLNPNPNGESAVVFNRQTNKAAIIGTIKVNARTSGASAPLRDFCIAYFIHIHKWKWAETEGFTLDQIIGEMGDDVFEKIELADVAKRLCK